MTEPNPTIKRILKVVQSAQSFRLLLAEFNHFGQRDQLIDQINHQLTTTATVQSIQLIPADVHIWLEQQLSPLAAQHTLIHLLIPTYNRDNQTALEQLFVGLNYLREALAQACPRPLLCWLSEDTLQKFALTAPDLWNWRSLVVNCSQPLSLDDEPTFITHEHNTAYTNPQPVQRLEAITDYLATHEPTPALAADLYLERGRLHRQLGNTQNALADFKQARQQTDVLADQSNPA